MLIADSTATETPPEATGNPSFHVGGSSPDLGLSSNQGC